MPRRKNNIKAYLFMLVLLKMGGYQVFVGNKT
ncbi:hypothetical protein EZS27_042681, partial [termite gut metagenome]